MESLGKSENRRGAAVHQGLSVYGNKGSTDQHAFVQQLRDGLHNFFVVFVRVLVDGVEEDVLVDEGTTSGDYLDGFWQGTRAALLEGGRHSATITLEQLDERSLAALIALFERAVGIYAELIDVNAYHQPGVEAGKTAAARVLELQAQVLIELDDKPRTAEEIAAALGADPLDVWPVLCHLAANRDGIHGGGILDPARSQFRRV
jgi:glucose-6-phosphate isomerase